MSPPSAGACLLDDVSSAGSEAERPERCFGSSKDAALSDETAGSYDVWYFFLPETEGRHFQLFKKVGHEGRSRPEIFILQGKSWRPATGLGPRIRGGEWDPSARLISSSEAWRLLEEEGWTTHELIGVFGAREGRREGPRP